MESRLAAEAPGRPGPGGRHLGRHRHLGEGALVRAQLQAGLDQGEPVGLHGHRLLALQQEQDRLERLLHHVALAGRVDAHHEGVRGQRAGPDPDHQAAPGQVVEQHHAVGQDEGVVVGQRRHAGAQADGSGALGGGGDEDLRGGDDLVSGRMVLAEPGLVEPERVQVLDQLQIALEGQRRVLAHRMERRQEDAEVQVAGGVNGGHGGARFSRRLGGQGSRVRGAPVRGARVRGHGSRVRGAPGSCRAHPVCAGCRRHPARPKGRRSR